MRRILTYLLQASAVIAALVIVAVGAFFIPAVQKTVLLRALSGPDTEVSVEEVRIRPGSAVISGLSMTTPEARVRFEDLTSRFKLAPLLFRRTIHVESLIISDILVETEEPDEPTDVDLWEKFEGLLIDLPIDFRVDTMDIDGNFRSPAGTAVAFAIHGRDLSSRGNEGRVDATLDVEDENLPGDGRAFAAIEVRPDFDSDGVFRQLCANLMLSESSDAPTLLQSGFCAVRTGDGEGYQLDVFAPEGPRPEHALLSATGEWSRENRAASGTVDIDFTRDMLPLDAGIETMPDFSLRTQTGFSLSEAGEMHLRSESTVHLSDMTAHYGMPGELDELTINALLDIIISDTRLSIDSLDVRIAEQQGIDLARIQAPSPLLIEFSGDGDRIFPDADQPLLFVELPGIPPELANLFLDDLRISADPITAQFALHARNGRFELDTPQPLSFRNLVLSGPEGELLGESEIRLDLSGFVSVSEFALDLGIDASIPQARSLSVELQSSGALPLAETTAMLEIQADGFPAEAPVSAAALSGTLNTSHGSDGLLPDLARFELAAEGALRPETSAHLPNRIILGGELRHTPDGLPYELNLILPDANDAPARPLISTRGTVAPDGSQIRGTARFDLPDWWAENLLEAYGTLRALEASGEVTYGGGLSPIDLDIGSTTRLTVDTGRTELPGDGRILLLAEAGFRLGDFVEIDSFHATVSPDGHDFLLRADLRQPILLQGGDFSFEILPQGELFEIEPGRVQLDEWIPGERRIGFEGGRLRGGLMLYRTGDELHIRPTGDHIEIVELRPGAPEGRKIPVLTLTMLPFAQIDEANANFGLESLVLSANDQPLLDASLIGRLPLNGPSRATGQFALNGNLTSIGVLLGENALPNLREGAFGIDADMTFDPENFHALWEGTLVIPDLRAVASETAYAITAEFNGEAVETRTQGRLLGRIDDGTAIQDLDLTFEADSEAEEPLPRVNVRGASEFLDLIRLGDLAGIFSRDPEPGVVPDDDPAPADPKPIDTLLPVNLQAEFTVARMKVMQDFDLYDVRVDLAGDDETIDVSQARIRFPDNAEIEVAATLSARNGTLNFASAGRGSHIDIAELLRRTQEVAEPNIEGIFSFDYEASSQGPVPAALPGGLDGVLNVAGRQGRLKLTVPDQRMERVRRLAGMQEGAIGSVIARVAGAPPGVRALAESVNLLTNIPYETIDVRLGMAEGRTLIIERMVLAGPYLYAAGTGSLEDLDPETPDNTRLDLRLDLGADGDLREQFRILGLLSEQQNELGYQMLRQRPVAVTGTLGEPNLREVWDLLIQAGVGAATAREAPAEERRRDPVEDAVDGLRDVFGW